MAEERSFFRDYFRDIGRVWWAVVISSGFVAVLGAMGLLFGKSYRVPSVIAIVVGLLVFNVAQAHVASVLWRERNEARAVPIDPNDDRQFLDISWRELHQIYKRAGTDVKGIRAVAPYVDRWIRVNGKLRQFSAPLSLGKALVSLQNEQQLFLWFSPGDDLQRLELLDPGPSIHVAGRVQEVSGLGVLLMDCRLERVIMPRARRGR